jgi:phosphoesterase RecJ-like protein
VSPDGDAFGSALGLMWGLRALGKTATVSIADPVPFNFHYLPGWEEIAPRQPTDEDLIVTVDGADAERLGAGFSQALVGNRPVVVIDHHVTNPRFGTFNWVDPRYPACAEMIYELLQVLKVPISPEIATCLLTGIATDTMGFTTDHTTAQVVQVAGELMRAGGDLPFILKQAYATRSLADARVWGRVLMTLQVEGHIAWAENRLADRRAVNATEEDGSGIASFMRGIEGVCIAALFVERDDGTTRVSLRSTAGWDIAQVAVALGGGGHPQAAGVTLEAPLAEAKTLVLDLLRRIPAPEV